MHVPPCIHPNSSCSTSNLEEKLPAFPHPLEQASTLYKRQLTREAHPCQKWDSHPFPEDTAPRKTQACVSSSFYGCMIVTRFLSNIPHPCRARNGSFYVLRANTRWDFDIYSIFWEKPTLLIFFLFLKVLGNAISRKNARKGCWLQNSIDFEKVIRVQTGQTASISVLSLLQPWKRTNFGDAAFEEWQVVLTAATWTQTPVLEQ